MKILVIHNQYLERGGEDGAVDREISMLKEFGHEVISYNRSNQELQGYGFFKKIKFLLKDIQWNPETYYNIKTLIEKERPDIAHVHNIFVFLSPSVYSALRQAKIPVVQTLHNYRFICMNGIFYNNNKVCEDCFSRKSSGVIKRCWRGSLLLSAFLARLIEKNTRNRNFIDSCDAFIALSEFSKSKFRQAGFPEGKFTVKPNFTESDINGAAKEDYGLFVGRLAGYKGVDNLVSAYERLKDRHLKIIGEGPLFSRLKDRIKDLKNIEMLGRLGHEETLRFLNKASFLVFPSQCYENMPLVIIESFACGTPVIASNLGAMKELIEDNITGLLFKPQDTEDLRDKISRLAGNKELIEKMSLNARRVYEAKFTKQTNYDMLMKIYNKAISGYKS